MVNLLYLAFLGAAQALPVGCEQHRGPAGLVVAVKYRCHAVVPAAHFLYKTAQRVQHIGQRLLWILQGKENDEVGRMPVRAACQGTARFAASDRSGNDLSIRCITPLQHSVAAPPEPASAWPAVAMRPRPPYYGW